MSYCSIRHCLPSYVHVHSCLKNTHTHDTNISEHSRAKNISTLYFHYGIQFFVIYEFIPSRFCSSDWNQILIFFQQVYLSECKNLNAYWKEITTGISKFKFRRHCDGFAKCFKYFILKYEIVLFKSRSYKVNISSVKILLTPPFNTVH